MNDGIRNEDLRSLRGMIDLFRSNIKEYKSNAYDEANTRVDFIDKFFELLGWDVRNDQKFSEQYREVVREDKVQIEGKQKAPDYSFRIGGVRKFFVEAKKPAVNIKEGTEPAFQTRRYAYTAKLPLSILTDFEEYAVYDTRIKPNIADKASTARIFYCTYEELLKPCSVSEGQTNFEFLYNTFGKNAILKGSFDTYVEENKRKKGTSEVDKEFLKLIEGWRNDLARNIAIRNKDIDLYNLNYAVQKIIDRLIFLRITEDRKMEEYGLLQKISKGNDVYKGLVDVFIKADNKYNSGLFHQEDWLNRLDIDDKVFSGIIKNLYYPHCPYEFSVMPIEILGHVYEQFLGKTIRLTASHQAKVEEKPEVRKAGGIYYTPQYIVEYIVKNTVGEKLKKQKPENVAGDQGTNSLSILDPACGSGSFLVGAYDYLLKWHLEYYTKSETRIKQAMKDGHIYQIDETTYQLSTEEKKKILTNNIYGVDLDSQAVEVTKLSLLLKLLEDENVESEGQLFKATDVLKLPDLSGNIKCGNSLIGSDFYAEKDLSLFGNEEMRKVNVFDWDKEFPEIFARGGFDVVI
ncbi:MAG: N-6 DNA methylase, partial [Spirochaetes bacterium]|nr:N-6 DNA methylase [Spirochaetota bacterium]